jgi:ATP-dependent RNA helicase DeaD
VVARYVPNAVEIQVETEALSVGHITQRYVRVTAREKESALLRLLAGTRARGTLVFARTRKRCGEVAEMLIRNSINADALHGDLNQGARERVLGRLRSKALDVVVATDVAARGLDVDHLTHVINYDMPDDAENYTHRIGRTARAGREGMAITLVEPRDRRRRLQFERELGAKIEQMDLPSANDIKLARREELVELIGGELVKPATVNTREWVREVLAAKGWSAEDFASAAVQLLSRELNFDLEVEPTVEPIRKDEINEVEIVISLGRRDGIRPADIVGSFTNDLGIAANLIGRISLGSRQAFVGLPAAVAKALLEAHSQIELRGRPASIALNQNVSATRADAPTHKPSSKKQHDKKPKNRKKARGTKRSKKKNKKNKKK